MSTNGVKDQVKANLLEHYSRRDPTNFYQYDVFYVGAEGGDDVVRPDADGDSLFSTFTTELMTGAPAVRLLITEGTDHETVCRALRKLLTLIIEDEAEDWPPYRFTADLPEDRRYAKGSPTPSDAIDWGSFARFDDIPPVELSEAPPAA